MIDLVADGRCRERAAPKADCVRLRVNLALATPAYVMAGLNSQALRHQAAELMHGVGRPRLGLAWFRGLKFPLAPLPEQQRIVDEIESYFTRLDDAVATLERVERNLKRYRASVLRAAVEGRLVPTEAELARQEGRDYEPASVLLERILAERRRRWSESGKKGTYQEPTPPDTSNLPALPDGWSWTTFDAVAVSIDGGNAATASDTPSPRTVLTSSAVRQGVVDFSDVRFLPEGAERNTDPYVLRGDLLFTRLSGSLEYVGNCSVVADDVPPRVEFPDRIFRARCASPVSRRYVQHCFGAKNLRRMLEKAAKSTAGHQRISLSDLRAFAIPLPPQQEQERIADETDQLVSAISRLQATVRANKHQARRMRQSILKWAFEGKLADQDPNDEPAAVLLERIKAERAATATPAKKQQRARSQPPARAKTRP